MKIKIDVLCGTSLLKFIGYNQILSEFSLRFMAGVNLHCHGIHR